METSLRSTRWIQQQLQVVLPVLGQPSSLSTLENTLVSASFSKYLQRQSGLLAETWSQEPGVVLPVGGSCGILAIVPRSALMQSCRCELKPRLKLVCSDDAGTSVESHLESKIDPYHLFSPTALHFTECGSIYLVFWTCSLWLPGTSRQVISNSRAYLMNGGT